MRLELENSLLLPTVHDTRADYEEYEDNIDYEGIYADDHRQDDYVYGE